MAPASDRRQEMMLRLLREAAPRPLSFQDFEAAGIRQPANLLYELELTGEPVERVYRRSASGARVLVGVRLHESQESPVASPRRSRWRMRRGS
jgi:hypothetical protein